MISRNKNHLAGFESIGLFQCSSACHDHILLFYEVVVGLRHPDGGWGSPCFPFGKNIVGAISGEFPLGAIVGAARWAFWSGRGHAPMDQGAESLCAEKAQPVVCGLWVRGSLLKPLLHGRCCSCKMPSRHHVSSDQHAGQPPSAFNKSSDGTAFRIVPGRAKAAPEQASSER